MQLREYQSQSIAAIYDYFNKGGDGDVTITIPTSGGKSLCMAKFIENAVQEYNSNIWVVTHVKELVKQDYDELQTIWPFAPAGIYCAGLNQKDLTKQITFGTVQSLRLALKKVKKVPDLLIWDEVHLLPFDENTAYRKFVSELKSRNPDLKVIGYTATNFRTNGGYLHKGEGALFSDNIFEVSVRELLDQGYLCPLITKATKAKLDTTGVHTRGGDYIQGELERAVDKEDLNEATVTEAMALAGDRKCWLFFCCGISHSKHIAEVLRSKGVAAEALTSENSDTERDKILDDFRSGKLKALCSMGILTTGFSHKPVDFIAMLRPTKSPVLYTQILGRGMRLHPDKASCLIGDFANNIAYHGPVDRLQIQQKGKGSGEAPVKECPNCSSMIFAGFRECPDCNYVFPINDKPKFDSRASTLAVISGQPSAPQELRVDSVKYGLHQKEDRPPCMRVTYQCGLLSVSEFIHFEINISRAERWWSARSKMPLPKNAKQALVFSKSLKIPSAIIVKQNGKYLNVENYLWSNVPYVQEKQTGTAGVFQQALIGQRVNT